MDLAILLSGSAIVALQAFDFLRFDLGGLDLAGSGSKEEASIELDFEELAEKLDEELVEELVEEFGVIAFCFIILNEADCT